MDEPDPSSSLEASLGLIPSKIISAAQAIPQQDAECHPQAIPADTGTESDPKKAAPGAQPVTTEHFFRKSGSISTPNPGPDGT